VRVRRLQRFQQRDSFRMRQAAARETVRHIRHGIAGPALRIDLSAFRDEKSYCIIIADVRRSVKRCVAAAIYGIDIRAVRRQQLHQLDEEYDPQGIRVVYCDEVYQKANTDFDKWLTENGYPVSSHAGIEDTSEMLYLGGDEGWVRKDLVATAVGTPRPKPGEKRPRRPTRELRH
jgi:hypothetical protein